jgi:hypothetical protein
LRCGTEEIYLGYRESDELKETDHRRARPQRVAAQPDVAVNAFQEIRQRDGFEAWFNPMKDTYIVIQQPTGPLLAQEVQKKIVEGYYPAGGVAVAPNGHLLQAVALEDLQTPRVAPGFASTGRTRAL